MSVKENDIVHKVGIDSLAIYTSRYLLDLAILAEARGADPDY